MDYKAIKAWDLKRLIIVLTILSALVSLINTLYAAYTVQRQQLIDENKNNNFFYATKLANSTNDFIHAAQQQLSVSSSLASNHFNDKNRLKEEVDRLRLQTNSFNSVVITDSNANVLATSPDALILTGKKLTTPGIIESIENKTPTVSDPYLSTVGNLLIFISHPIHDKNGTYIGMLGGTIYLKRESILHNLLGEHYHTDGSYIYVVDKYKKLIYHPDRNRIGTAIEGNPIVDKLSFGLSGSDIVTNTSGIEMIAGYAVVASTGWGIVAQRPLSATLLPLSTLMWNVFIKTLPAALISLIVIWACARKIAKPLRLLANSAHSMDDPETEKKIQGIKSWYFESQELKKAMIFGISLLNLSIKKLKEDVQTDPLTRLGNRRSLEIMLNRLYNTKQKFSVISVDIDHFKNVNDTYGHDIGDVVLQELAQHMRSVCRADDLPCRVGGEEFLIIIPNSDNQTALHVAERLRKQVQEATFKSVGNITVSIGVSSWPTGSYDLQAVLKYADEMLYKAKKGGRNRVEVFNN